METNHDEDVVFGRDRSDRQDVTHPTGIVDNPPISGTELRRRLITPESLVEPEQPPRGGFLRRLLRR